MVDIDKLLKELGFVIRRYDTINYSGTYLGKLPKDILNIIFDNIQYNRPNDLINKHYYLFKTNQEDEEAANTMTIICFDEELYKKHDVFNEIKTIIYDESHIINISENNEELWYHDDVFNHDGDIIDNPIELEYHKPKSYLAKLLINY